MVMKIKWSLQNALTEGMNKSFAGLFESVHSNSIIQNVNTELKWVRINSQIDFPVSVNGLEVENSFVCSPYTAYARYAKDELKHKVPNKLIQIIVLGILKLFEAFLKFGNIDRNIHINNYLLSTNPYPEWDGKEIGEITDFVKEEYPKHAIIFRSINRYQHEALIKQFEKNGYQKIGSRQVYIYDMDYENWMEHQNNKHDKRIIKKQNLQYIPHEEMGPYLEEALALYNKLYLVKYSEFNPQFSLTYFKHCHEHGIMHFQGYKDAHNQLKTFSGLFIVGDTITSPLVGYDTSAPQNEGLYIHAINLIMQYKFKTGKLLNLSSGASKFKRLRGGNPSIEYSLIYIKHLSMKRRITWRILQFISNKIGIPLMEKYEL